VISVAKPRFLRFHDLNRSAVNVEWQVHTTQTDGEASIADVLSTAHERGLASIAFTEHVRKETAWFDSFAGEVRRASNAFPGLVTYVGCETKAMDLLGNLDVSESILAACDVVLGVVHRFPDGKGGYLDFKSMPPDQVATMEFELSLGMIRNSPIDVLGHPGGMYQRRHGVFPEHLFRALMEETVKHGIAIEINSSYLADMKAFLRLCEEVNPHVSIGSDAHKLIEIGRCRDILLETLKL
jgi:putative hydrolase